MKAATMGMIRSFTAESTIFPNAAPMITPTAKSMTLPLTAKALNSFNMLNPLCIKVFELSLAYRSLAVEALRNK